MPIDLKFINLPKIFLLKLQYMEFHKIVIKAQQYLMEQKVHSRYL